MSFKDASIGKEIIVCSEFIVKPISKKKKIRSCKVTRGVAITYDRGVPGTHYISKVMQMIYLLISNDETFHYLVIVKYCKDIGTAI